VDGTIAESVVRRPPAMLRPYVESYVGYRYAGFAPGEHMGLPSRHLTFIVAFDAPLELTRLPDGTERTERFDTLLGGLHTTPAVIRHDGSQHGIQLQVTPAGARALFRMPAGELVSTVVTLDQVWGRLAGELADRLAVAADWPARFAVLDGVLLRVLSTTAELPSGARPQAAEAFRRLASMHGLVDVASLADELGWSRRHLTEQFSVEYGVGPKAMARVLRFERARWMLVQPEHPSLATVAATCGYADQAHMTREWHALAGASPAAWLAAEELPFVQDGMPEGGGG
jgi:AraC-like DNA-binding protein